MGASFHISTRTLLLTTSRVAVLGFPVHHTTRHSVILVLSVKKPVRVRFTPSAARPSYYAGASRPGLQETLS